MDIPNWFNECRISDLAELPGPRGPLLKHLLGWKNRGYARERAESSGRVSRPGVIAAVAPEDLDHFADDAEVYFADPESMRPGRAGEQTLSVGVEAAVTALTIAVLYVAVRYPGGACQPFVVRSARVFVARGR
jgi:hypothetical protein